MKYISLKILVVQKQEQQQLEVNQRLQSLILLTSFSIHTTSFESKDRLYENLIEKLISKFTNEEVNLKSIIFALIN